jgi:hypothetical protein
MRMRRPAGRSAKSVDIDVDLNLSVNATLDVVVDQPALPEAGVGSRGWTSAGPDRFRRLLMLRLHVASSQPGMERLLVEVNVKGGVDVDVQVKVNVNLGRSLTLARLIEGPRVHHAFAR